MTAPTPNRALINGVSATGARVWNRGLHYGDGVFRTCLIYKGQVIDIDMQIDKVINDAEVISLYFSERETLLREAQQLAQGQQQAVLKILLIRAGAARGYRTSVAAADRLLCTYPTSRYPAANWERGIVVFRSRLKLGSQPMLAGVKHLNRLEQILASREWEPGSDEGILADDQNRPVSGTRGNLFWAGQGVLRTPALDRCGVAGLMRDKVLQAAAALKLPCRVAEGSWEELEQADEVFVTNSLVGLWPVRAMGDHTWAAPGPLTRRLMETLQHPQLRDV